MLTTIQGVPTSEGHSGLEANYRRMQRKNLTTTQSRAGRSTTGRRGVRSGSPGYFIGRRVVPSSCTNRVNRSREPTMKAIPMPITEATGRGCRALPAGSRAVGSLNTGGSKWDCGCSFIPFRQLDDSTTIRNRLIGKRLQLLKPRDQIGAWPVQRSQPYIKPFIAPQGVLRIKARGACSFGTPGWPTRPIGRFFSLSPAFPY
jgi:hypothetical protein